MLISGDFNIHVYCTVYHLATDFKRHLATFDLARSVEGPTHYLGHTLDLIIFNGLYVSLREISETAILDHLLIIFEVGPPPSVSRPLARLVGIASSSPQWPESLLLPSKTCNFLPWNYWFLPNAQKTFCLLSTPPVLGSSTPLHLFGVNPQKPRADPWLN